jgi:hypothetical protein
MWIAKVKSDFEEHEPGLKSEECGDRGRWHEVVEAEKALNGLVYINIWC